ncbi:AMP-dependent synthetase and ligase [Xylanimonas cellulosilytica DSM 15894]|uniref:AMP-dependent synthetase and ligase n=1 Tax=Xylanimonas cellulosilytica (strain DSM 15894 / JCM 12276 / CECT 5975 / KCTC 9989 / LMG 20990 / NBRC 107835 / XIL07) TaxID=446471 RepID=D1BTL3_XYLCX|nr:AMP-binding protein [Xylanimonas cellulosilytica]ACZ30992.1 AMP-dependent synthetase and ligase [Xylanimonas cellulosilytica DSM 15894]
MNATPQSVAVPDWPLPAALDLAARQYPDRVALDFLGATTTYRALADTVACAAATLAARGVRAGDRVAIALPNSPSHVVGFWAALRLGAVVVELNPTLGAAETARLIADSGARVVLAWAKTAADIAAASPESDVVPVDISRDLPRAKQWALRLPIRKARTQREALSGSFVAGGQTPHWHALVASTPPLPGDHPAPSPDDLAVLMYTGGTTGEPKAVMLRHRHLAVNAIQGRAWTGHDAVAPEVVYGVLPYFHAFGLQLCLVYATLVAATVVVLPKFDVATVLSAQRRRPGTFLPAVPPMLARLTQAARERGADLSSFRIAISGSMALPAETARAWEETTGGLVIEGYGMTETSPVALGSPLDERRRPGALGLPFPSTRIRVADPEDPTRDVAPGERGELLIAGPQVFDGYWNRPEETAQALLPGGWLRTGDIVTIDDDGFVTLVDRTKEIIVTGGFKVYPSQVEARLREMPQIADVAVVGMPAGDLGERVVAAIVLAKGVTSLDLPAVREWASTQLARYAVPRGLVVVTDLPRSAIGKVMRRMVREQLLATTPA